MASQDQINWLVAEAKAAKAAGHIFPEMAACEAALESAWGTSELARVDHNLFGCKQHIHPIYGTVHIPTREFINAKWITIEGLWVQYPNDAASFADRMQTLRTLMGMYPSYVEALIAPDAETYVTDVSRTWSTDPNRAANCIEIYHAHKAELEAA